MLVKCNIFSFLILLTLVLTSPNHYAQIEIGTTINPIGSGARAMGLGNAFIALSDDATAASWNPAGLIQLETPEFSFAFETISRRETLRSSTNPEIESSDSLKISDFNYVSIVFPFYYRTSMVVSLNYLKLYRFDKDLTFPVSKPGTLERNFLFDFEQDGEFSVVAPAYGIFLHPRLSLGITLNIWNNDLTDSSSYTKRQRAKGTFEFMGSPGEFSTMIEDRFIVERGTSFVLGGLFRFNDRWNLGVVVKPNYTLSLDHTNIEISQQTGGLGSGSDTTVTKLDSKLEFPTIIGCGIGYRPIDPLTFSIDVTWTNWSEYVLKENNQKFNPISGRSIEEGKLNDTYTIRMGYEYLLVKEKFLIPFRGGFGFDPSPATRGRDEFYTVSLGTGLQIGNYNLDFAWEMRWGNNVNSDLFPQLNAHQDVRQHRLMASLVYYF